MTRRCVAAHGESGSTERNVGLAERERGLGERKLACAERARFIHGGEVAFSEQTVAVANPTISSSRNATLRSRSGTSVGPDANDVFPESKRAVVGSTLGCAESKPVNHGREGGVTRRV